MGGLAKLYLGRRLSPAGGGLPAALPLPLEPVGGVLFGLMLLKVTLVMVVVNMMSVAAVLAGQGGAIDGDEVRPRRGGHRVGGVHLPAFYGGKSRIFLFALFLCFPQNRVRAENMPAAAPSAAASV